MNLSSFAPFNMTNRNKLIILLSLIPIKIAFIILFIPDPSLAIVTRLHIIPYGLVWDWTNWPIFYFQLYPWYSLYILALDIPLSLVMLKKTSSLNFLAFQFYLFLTYLGGWLNSTVYLFAAFGEINPIFTILSIVSKIPVTNCLACINYAFEPFHFATANGNSRLTTYAEIMLSWILGLALYMRKKRRAQKTKNSLVNLGIELMPALRTDTMKADP